MTLAHSFCKAKRLCRPRDFQTVYANNQVRAKGQYFTVLAFCCFDEKAENHTIGARLGVVVSKKVSKKAIRRNTLKRLMRERFRVQNLPRADYIVLARPEARDVDNKLIIKDLNYVWQKIKHRVGDYQAS